MLYLGEKELETIGCPWDRAIDAIADTIDCMRNHDYAQPVKPFLRYRDELNRIIAMPAFVGGPFDVAGIKWIASFPHNVARQLPRAHSVTVLNDSHTGVPTTVICTALLSIWRTAAVSGYVLKNYLRTRRFPRGLRVGICGDGPIGRAQQEVFAAVLGSQLAELRVFDVRPAEADPRPPRVRSERVTRWEDAYDDADVFATCTSSTKRYIDRAPKPGSLHLNVSLRDYKSCTFEYFAGGLVVDDWTEVCREDTDIEMFAREKGLAERDVATLVEFRERCCGYPSDQPLMFNPMGLAVFDISTAAWVRQKAIEGNMGVSL
jgi:2,3-diaminopropionate biosynthesis protein SbnB